MWPITALVVATTLYVYGLAVLSSRVRPAEARAADDRFFFVLLVPALNEEQVIAKTITSLLALRGNFLALVIDDASDDGTVAAIRPFLADPRLRLVEQPRDRARRGKGHVLNTGYGLVRRLGLVERHGAENIVVVVFDSDGRVEPDFLEAVAPYFRDPAIAGVQSAVRMYNADQNLLTLWQHLEFAIWGKLFCRAKNRLGSATLGGNGQCVRLSALADLGAEPWQPSSLTEDLEMSLRLLTLGWQLRFCPSVAVWQEAVPRLRPLVRQRSRWLQGHVVCWRYLPALLRSPLPLQTRIDLLIFLLLPTAFLPIGLASVASIGSFLLHPGQATALGLLVWYLLGFGMAPLVMGAWWGIGRPRPWRLIFHGHLFVFYSFIWFLAALVVYRHILVGRRGWAKTSRVAWGRATRRAWLSGRRAATALAGCALLGAVLLTVPSVFARSEGVVPLWPVPRAEVQTAASTQVAALRRPANALPHAAEVAMSEVVSGRIEGLGSSPAGSRSLTTVHFDFGDEREPPWAWTVTREVGPGGHRVEQLAIGSQAWQHLPDDTWVALSTADGIWDQLRTLLPRLDASARSGTRETIGDQTTVRWYDPVRNADVALQLDRTSGLPLQQREELRATGEVITVTYMDWNRPGEITPPAAAGRAP
jgi:cellulose synthase/poly-beta-1,6-N-acetylglucosamine synthase-like glycosyltransferase